MKTCRSHLSRIPTPVIAFGLVLVGALGVGGAAQALLADTATQVVTDDSGSEAKPGTKPSCVCEK